MGKARMDLIILSTPEAPISLSLSRLREHSFNIIYFLYLKCFLYKGKSKIYPVTGRGGLEGCEISRMQHRIDNPLAGGVEVVSLTRRQRFNNKKYFLVVISVRG
jgi:hypothetical protein